MLRTFLQRKWQRTVARPLTAATTVALLAALPHDVTSTNQKTTWTPEISAMGAIARGDEPRPIVPAITTSPDLRVELPGVTGLQGTDKLVHSPTALDFQSETTIGQTAGGLKLVAGYNDIRGFSLPSPSVSGYSYSIDGGATWTDGGQLPTTGAGDQVYGDPDIKTWKDGGGSEFVFYSSLYTTSLGSSSLCVHVSTDGGATWSLPREVTAATSPTDFPDKEYIDVDPETGRLMISWTNFGASTTMRTAYSDDKGLTWSAATTFAFSGQGSVPRFDPTSTNAYIVWWNGSGMTFVKSVNNGTAWGAPGSIVAGLVVPMNPYGSDRINGFPSMDVDASNGNIYIVYAARQSPPDFSDVYFMRSTNLGVSWSAPAAINAAPGSDRAQFFPWITAEEGVANSLSAIWYDQILGSGTSDITDVMHAHSSDGGVSWTCPTPLNDDRFHAEYGNTTSQPNIGDYIQAVAINGRLYTAFAKTGKASHLTYSPDTYVDVHVFAAPLASPISLLGYSFTDAGCSPGNGYMDPCETISFSPTIKHYSSCFPSISGISATLSTTDPLVTVTVGSANYGPLGGLNTAAGVTTPFEFIIDPSFPCGAEVEFLLRVVSSQGESRIPITLRIGKPVSALLMDEKFDAVVAPALPGGWTPTTVSGTANAWRTSTTFASTGPNALFCADIATTSLNRVQSPSMVIPAGTELVQVDFDVTHNIELDTERRAWDGALMRVRVNGTNYLAGSFASLFEPFYPWQMNRQSSSTQPLQDLSCWSSNTTPSFSHVTMQFPGLAGSTVELVFDMGTDGSVGSPTGMFVDNVRVNALDYDCTCTGAPVLTAAPGTITFVSVPVNTTAYLPVTITNTGGTPLVITGILGCDTAPFSLDLSATDSTLAKGQSTIINVCVMPTLVTGEGPDSCEITLVSNDPSGNKKVKVFLTTVTGVGDGAPSPFQISGIVPNPFNPETTIRFTLPQAEAVTAEIWSVSGERIRVLARDRRFEAGESELRWNGRNDRGQTVASGVYFVRVRTSLGERVARAVMLK